MGFEQNLAFAHFGDALAEDYPGGGTQSNPPGTTNPGVSGGALVCDGSQAITFTYGADIFDPGTGDLAIAIRFIIRAGASSGDVLLHLGTDQSFSNELMVNIDSAVSRTLELGESFSSSVYCEYSGNYEVDTPLTLVWMREGNPSAWQASTAYAVGDVVQPTTSNGFKYECTAAGTTGAGEPTWPTTKGNTVVDGGVTWTCRTLWTCHLDDGSDVTGSINTLDGSYNVTGTADATLGTKYDSSGVAAPVDILWAAVWTRALTYTERSTRLNETELKNDILGGGGGSSIVPIISNLTAPQSGGMTL